MTRSRSTSNAGDRDGIPTLHLTLRHRLAPVEEADSVEAQASDQEAEANQPTSPTAPTKPANPAGMIDNVPAVETNKTPQQTWEELTNGEDDTWFNLDQTTTDHPLQEAAAAPPTDPTTQATGAAPATADITFPVTLDERLEQIAPWVAAGIGVALLLYSGNLSWLFGDDL